MNEQAIIEKIALTATNAYRIRKGLDPVSSIRLLDTECMDDALAEAQAIYAEVVKPLVDGLEDIAEHSKTPFIGEKWQNYAHEVATEAIATLEKGNV